MNKEKQQLNKLSKEGINQDAQTQHEFYTYRHTYSHYTTNAEGLCDLAGVCNIFGSETGHCY